MRIHPSLVTGLREHASSVSLRCKLFSNFNVPRLWCAESYQDCAEGTVRAGEFLSLGDGLGHFILPSLSLLNGHEGYVYKARQASFICGFKLHSSGAGEVGFDPTLSIVQSGVLMQAKGTVSGDRRRMTLSLHPRLVRHEEPDQ